MVGGLALWEAGVLPAEASVSPKSSNMIAIQEPFQTLLGFAIDSWAL